MIVSIFVLPQLSTCDFCQGSDPTLLLKYFSNHSLVNFALNDDLLKDFAVSVDGKVPLSCLSYTLQSPGTIFPDESSESTKPDGRYCGLSVSLR